MLTNEIFVDCLPGKPEALLRLLLPNKHTTHKLTLQVPLKVKFEYKKQDENTLSPPFRLTCQWAENFTWERKENKPSGSKARAVL